MSEKNDQFFNYYKVQVLFLSTKQKYFLQYTITKYTIHIAITY